MLRFRSTIANFCNHGRNYKHLWGAFLAATFGTAAAFSVVDQRKLLHVKQDVNLGGKIHDTSIAIDTRSSIAKDISINLRSIMNSNTALCESLAEEEAGVDASMEIDTELPVDDPKSYYYEKMTQPSRSQAENHAIFGTLKGPGFIERYEVYKRVMVTDSTSEHTDEDKESIKKEVMVADVKIGKNLNGHPGIVHGGIISLLMDDTLGWGCEAMDLRNGVSYGDDDCPIVVTANLSIDFRTPLPAGSSVVIRVYHDKTEGRKVYASARMESFDGSVLYSEATVLFIIIPMSRLKQKD